MFQIHTIYFDYLNKKKECENLINLKTLETLYPLLLKSQNSTWINKEEVYSDFLKKYSTRIKINREAFYQDTQKNMILGQTKKHSTRMKKEISISDGPPLEGP